MKKMSFVHGIQSALMTVAIASLSMITGCGIESTTTIAPPAAAPTTQPAAAPATQPANPPAAVAESDSSQAQADDVDHTGQPLRHAVFFSFKDDSSKEEVQGVADAFAALPDKIDAITDFQWGINNSPEGLDDGFTHCFLLSFADTAGRDVYIPHPAHAGEFADVLRPHMKDVFVFDYWGTASETKIEKELKHAVFFKFKDDASAEDVKKTEEAFAALPSKIDAIKAFEWGINNSPEKKADGFTHCFMVTFDSEEGRKAYLPHPEHLAFVEILKPVLDKVRVLDFWEQ